MKFALAGKSLFKLFSILSICFYLSSLTINAQEKTSTVTDTAIKKANSRPPEASSEPFDKATVKEMGEKCVRLETESGNIEIEFFPENAPETVRNFLNLTSLGAFDTTTFSRIVPGFVVQGGNIWTREKLPTEMAKRARKTVPDEPNQILHERGVLSLARSDEPNTATSHFFILVSEAPNLNGKFAAFGRVIKGMEIVDAINKMSVVDEKPDKPVKINRALIFACPVKNSSN